MTIPAPTTPESSNDAAEYQGLNSFTGSASYEWASESEAIAGTETAKMMSPATTKKAIETLVDLNTGTPFSEIWDALLMLGGDDPAGIASTLDELNGETISGSDLGNLYTMADSLNGEVA